MISATVLFIPASPRSFSVSLMFCPPITSPATSIPVFATLPRFCLPMRFVASATISMTKHLKRQRHVLYRIEGGMFDFVVDSRHGILSGGYAQQ